VNFRHYFDITFRIDSWTAIAVFAIVAFVLTFALVRYRAGRGHEPSKKSEHDKVEIAYACLLVVIASGLTALSVTVNSDERRPIGPPAVTVQVTAFRWCWRFHYLHTPVTVTGNCDPTDPTLVLPQGETVLVQLTSNDVVHEFWVPAFRWKIEAFPDHDNDFELRTDRTGNWVGRCSVYCGLYHFRMDFRVAVVSRSAFASFMHSHGASAAAA
jgi:cytochrome c oxidase subunit 2